MLQQRKSLIAVLLLFDLSALAQNDSIMQNRKWYVPTGITAEYAGGFGMVSAGALFTPLKKTELAIIGGYTPVEFGNIWTVNLLFSYSPLQLKLNERLSLYPINVGAFTSFSIGKNIYLDWPEKYVPKYYWWTSSMRFGPFVEADLKYTFKNKKQSITFFFQCLTNDLYIYT